MEVFDVALVPLCCCVTSLFASPTLTVDNRSQRMNLCNVLMLFWLQKVMCGNFFYIQIQSKDTFSWLTLDCMKNSHSWNEIPSECVVISELLNMLHVVVLTRGPLFDWWYARQCSKGRRHIKKIDFFRALPKLPLPSPSPNSGKFYNFFWTLKTTFLRILQRFFYVRSSLNDKYM